MPEHTPAPTPARSLYGFFMYLLSKTVLVLYCIWAFVPDQYLHYLNIYYYPQKYWATAVPIQLLVALTLFAFFVYPSLNMMLSPRIDSINTITDPAAFYTVKTNHYNYTVSDACICTDESQCTRHSYEATPKEFNENTVPPLHDLNIRFVSKKLYATKQRKM